jgi:hypothetical protein
MTEFLPVLHEAAGATGLVTESRDFAGVLVPQHHGPRGQARHLATFEAGS